MNEAIKWNLDEANEEVVASVKLENKGPTYCLVRCEFFANQGEGRFMMCTYNGDAIPVFDFYYDPGRCPAGKWRRQDELGLLKRDRPIRYTVGIEENSDR
jgi:hypothetical protein